ncbi:MAG TPA: HAMP domain-containing protein, partial [Gammaproteobacteria bacterium]|nr:HAMP domain-containing protein [Gammaproteobacteria bacterium]
MKQDHSLSFRYKLITGFVMVILILSASMGITLYRMFKVTHLGIDAIENRYPMAMLAHDAVFKINQSQSYLHSYLLTGDASYYQSYKNILGHLASDIGRISQYESGQEAGEKVTAPGLKTTLRLLTQLGKAGERIDYLQKNPRDNYLIMTEAAERLNPLALQYLGFLNEYIEEMRDKAINRRNLDILNRLTDLRHNWSQMLAGLRIALASHTLDNMTDVITYLDVSRIQLNELQNLKPELGIEGISTLSNIHDKYDSALDEFRLRYEKSDWREDIKLMKTVVLPSMHELENLLGQVSTRQSNISRKVGVLLTDSLEGIRTGAVIILILAVLLAVMVATLLIQSLVKPVHELIRAANDVANGNLSARVTPQANDEFGELAVRFNDMVSRLRSEMNQKDVAVSELTYKVNQAEQSSIEKSEFLARLSYELRIPLTTVVGYAEVMLSDARDAHDQAQEKITAGIIESSQVLMHLVDEVVVLADMESGNVELESSNVRV